MAPLNDSLPELQLPHPNKGGLLRNWAVGFLGLVSFGLSLFFLEESALVRFGLRVLFLLVTSTPELSENKWNSQKWNVNFCTDRWTAVHCTVGSGEHRARLSLECTMRGQGAEDSSCNEINPTRNKKPPQKRWSHGCPHLLPDCSQHLAGWGWATCPNPMGSPAWSWEQEMRPPQPPPAGWPSGHSGENKVPSPLAESTLWMLTSYRLKIPVVMTWKNHIAIF